MLSLRWGGIASIQCLLAAPSLWVHLRSVSVLSSLTFACLSSFAWLDISNTTIHTVLMILSIGWVSAMCLLYIWQCLSSNLKPLLPSLTEHTPKTNLISSIRSSITCDSPISGGWTYFCSCFFYFLVFAFVLNSLFSLSWPLFCTQCSSDVTFNIFGSVCRIVVLRQVAYSTKLF